MPLDLYWQAHQGGKRVAIADHTGEVKRGKSLARSHSNYQCRNRQRHQSLEDAGIYHGNGRYGLAVLDSHGEFKIAEQAAMNSRMN